MSEADDRQIEQLATDLEAFILQRFNYKRKCVFGQWNTLDVHRKRVHLYLRFKPKGFWPEDTLVIARIEFLEQRKGHGTALLLMLAELADKYGYKRVGVEILTTPAIFAFVRKF
jgi:GNAT superfamily N-acetyltransferase